MKNVNAGTDIKITAIMPNYNSSKFLPKSLRSLLNQTEAFIEIIIVDDGSTDDSLVLIDNFMKEYPTIRLIKHEKNQGVCAALNTGIMQAKGDFITLCAADDWYQEDMVKLAKEAIRKFPSAGLICGDAVVYRFDMQNPFRRMLPYPKNVLISPQEFQKLTQKHYTTFNGGGLIMNRDCVLKAGMLHPQLCWHADWFLYFIIAFQQGISYIDSVFVYINMRKQSYSEGKKDWRIQKQVMIDTIVLLKQKHPELWNIFKESALLPYYPMRSLPLFLFHPKLRSFLSALLIWKFIINNKSIVRIGRLFPYRVVLNMRKFLKA